MNCRHEQFEMLEREARNKHNDKICDGMFEDLYAKVREYAQQRRLEQLTRKSRGDPMDVGQLQQSWDGWSYAYQPQDEHDDQSNVDALGKGKALTKGKEKGQPRGTMSVLGPLTIV